MIRTALIVFAAVATLGAESLLPPLEPQQAAEAAKIVAGFEANPRGPFYRIRWFCPDGKDYPPSPYPCEKKGTGRQHATLSAEALQLEKWNIDVGTIFAAMTFDEFFDAARDHHRLKELVAERYLEETQDGWIYRKAYTYRGARQAEDEERDGRRLLIQAFSRPDWLRKRLFLAQQVAGAVPHGLPSSALKRARNLAKAVADVDPSFQPLRAKIHSSPDFEQDRVAVEDYIKTRQPTEAVQKMLRELAAILQEENAGRLLSARLAVVRKRPDSPLSPLVEAFADALRRNEDEAIHAAGSRLSAGIVREVLQSTDGAGNLELLDFNALVTEASFRHGYDPHEAHSHTRRELLEQMRNDFYYAFGAGLLSERQLGALEQRLDALLSDPQPAADEYFEAVRYLSRAAEWCRATAAREFSPVEQRFRAFEPRTAGLLDHLLRSSPALPLSTRAQAVVDDAARAAGLRHQIFGSDSAAGVFGLNPGRALARLEILDSPDQPIHSDRIYVIPETVSDLKPMAGVLTLDSGNALSHAQLLAANLGLPNAVAPSSLLPVLREHVGQEVLFEVGRRGEVTLRVPEPSELAKPALNEAPARRLSLDVSRLKLEVRDLLRLEDLSETQAGVTCGPKAANLGRLAQMFPGRVSPGLVVPFGVYVEHIQRPMEGDTVPLAARISEAFDRAEQMRASGAPEQEVQAYIYPQLDRFRAWIRRMPFEPAFEAKLRAALRGTFGADRSYGVFVRSDTNAEDLPQFSGAGLNLTVPNVVGEEKILQAIRDVWASPLQERAYDWRSRMLDRQDRVYPSVLLQKTVQSDKSGVIATVNLDTGARDEITINVNEGVSAVVDGGVAESLLLGPNGKVTLLQQARATYRKVARPEGGFAIVPPIGDAAVLQPNEIEQVRALVAEVEAKYPPSMGPDGKPLPWDIELGFQGGELRLFQIRPLVRWRSPQPIRNSAPVKLDEVL